MPLHAMAGVGRPTCDELGDSSLTFVSDDFGDSRLTFVSDDFGDSCLTEDLVFGSGLALLFPDAVDLVFLFVTMDEISC